jgi:hypothetical protein
VVGLVPTKKRPTDEPNLQQTKRKRTCEEEEEADVSPPFRNETTETMDIGYDLTDHEKLPA